MTGFGRAVKQFDGREISVEIKSVNSRYFDCSVKMGRQFSYLEEKIKPYLQSRGVSRGKVDVYINVESIGSANLGIGLDEGFIKGYLEALYALRDRFDLKDDITVMNVAKRPEVFVSVKPEDDSEKDWQELCEVLSLACDAFLASREREGEKLCRDIREKIETVKGHVDTVEALSADSVVHYRERLAERIRDALADNKITPDENRILTECAIFADKVAVDEEIVRLRAHLTSLEDIFAADEPVGRRLDFLLQEMNREINTTGSKCNDAEIARVVVEVKCILEKIREQIQNLE
jgi:uncharacterized protein (TIGR00255 family)